MTADLLFHVNLKGYLSLALGLQVLNDEHCVFLGTKLGADMRGNIVQDSHALLSSRPPER